MKKILIGLLLLMGGLANAQIGIDLTEMIPAPDSGYMIITTGDEYPDRGLQKYVRASDVLGIDTMFQNGDSLCILMRSEEAYRCFPVHREVRLEKVDGGLRVCWEQRDTICETRNYLHFPGTSGSYVEARDVHDFEIGDEDAEIEVEVRIHNYSRANTLFSTSYHTVSGGGVGGYISRTHTNTNIEFSLLDGDVIYQRYAGPNRIPIEEWGRVKGVYSFQDSISRIIVNDVQRSAGKFVPKGDTIENAHSLLIGKVRSDVATQSLRGDVRHFQFNDEYILFDDYGADSLITNKGAVLDIGDDVVWRADTLGYTGIDTSHHCEIIPLTDNHLTDVEHLGDSIRFTLSDSVIFTVRDSFIPQENIIGWIDERIPDTVFFAKTSTATKAIEFGDTLELKGGAININIPVEVDYFPNTNQLEICWTEIELPDQELQDEGMGSEFNQGGGQVQQLPADTIRLCDTIHLNDVFIDTVFHDGDSMRFVRNDGKTWAVQDSFRTDDDIMDLIDMMYDPQWLTVDREGNEITIGISDGNSIIFIDSVRTNQEIAEIARDSIEIPESIHIDSVSHSVDSFFLFRSDGRVFSLLDYDTKTHVNQIDGNEIEVCYEGIDTVWNIRNYLHFPGDNNSYVMARDITDLEVGVGDLDAEVRVRIGEDQPDSWSSIIQTIYATSQDGWGFTRRNSGNDYQSTITYNGSSLTSAYSSDDTTWMDLQVLYENSTGTNTFIVNGDTVQIMQNDHFENINLENGHILSMGRYSHGAGTTYMLKGDISYFRFNDEEFLFEDFGSDTLLGSEGTVLDILGDVEWRKDTLGFTLSEFHYCDTIELNDIHVTSFTRSGASLYLDLSNGQTFAVRDSFLTEQEIQDMVDVNRSWLLKDGGVPDNATDTVYRDGVAVIEGSRWNKTISSNSLDLRSTSPIWLPSFFLQAFVEDEINPIITDQIYSTPFSSERILSVSKRDFSESTSIWLDSRSGVRFLPYGTGQYEATPTYLLGVDASGLIKEVRPTSGIDTIIHLGDSVFFDFDDKTFTIRDSVRSDAEIITLIEANRIFQQLGRSGDFITLSEGGGQVLDLHLKDAIHTGDSVKLVLSDGRNITFRDSSLSVDAVRDMILEEIPETVFYVKQGSVTAPVNWGDVVELENGTVNVNMPTKVKMIDSLNALEVCIWQVVKVIESDTTYRNYIEFNGTNSSYGYRAESSTPRVPIELPFSFRFS